MPDDHSIFKRDMPPVLAAAISHQPSGDPGDDLAEDDPADLATQLTYACEELDRFARQPGWLDERLHVLFEVMRKFARLATGLLKGLRPQWWPPIVARLRSFGGPS